LCAIMNPQKLFHQMWC